MKTRTLYLLFTLLVGSLVGFGGEKSGLRWMKLEDALPEAQHSNKKILIDVYTDWCGWCKKMDAQTYSNNEVTAILNKNYVLVKLDAESKERATYKGKPYTKSELSAAFGITGYPSMIFLDSNGDPITIYPGYAEADRFGKVLTFIGEDHYKVKSFEEFLRSSR